MCATYSRESDDIITPLTGIQSHIFLLLHIGFVSTVDNIPTYCKILGMSCTSWKYDALNCFTCSIQERDKNLRGVIEQSINTKNDTSTSRCWYNHGKGILASNSHIVHCTFNNLRCMHSQNYLNRMIWAMPISAVFFFLSKL